MTTKEVLLVAFYMLAFGLTVFAGVKFGFTGNSHTPPFPFGIEVICLPIGLTLFLIDLFTKSGANAASVFRVHAFGLTANALLTLFIIAFAF